MALMLQSSEQLQGPEKPGGLPVGSSRLKQDKSPAALPAPPSKPGSSHQGSAQPGIQDKARHHHHQKATKDSSQHRSHRKDSSSGHGHPSSSHRKPQHKDDKKGAVVPYTSFTPDSKDNRLKRPSTFLCKIFFTNDFPEPASQPKLVPTRNDPNRHTSYTGCSLERDYRQQLHLEPDLGIPLDLLDMSPYLPPSEDSRPPLDPEDERLLRDDDVASGAGRPGPDIPGHMRRPVPSSAAGPRASLLHNRPMESTEGINWLMSTQYIAPAELDAERAKKVSLTEQEAKMLALQLELADMQEQLATREGRISCIEESFRVAQEPPVHPTNPALKPVEVLPLVPYLERESQRFWHVMFDEEPLKDSRRHSRLPPLAVDALESQAVLKQFKPPSAEEQKFLGYMVPTRPDREQVEAQLDEGREVPYTWVREYHYELHLPVGGQDDGRGDKETFLFCFADDCVRYLRLKGRMQLDKLKKLEAKRAAGSQPQDEEAEDSSIPVPSRITVQKVDDGERGQTRSAKRLRAESDDSE